MVLHYGLWKKMGILHAFDRFIEFLQMDRSLLNDGCL